MACGGPQQPCCDSTIDNGDLYRCPRGWDSDAEQPLSCSAEPFEPGICEPCGGAGQPCCYKSRIAELPDCSDGFGCDPGGVCAPCGGVGDICCADDRALSGPACTEGGVCSDGGCVECGGLAQPCCASSFEDLRHRCGHAGAPAF